MARHKDAEEVEFVEAGPRTEALETMETVESDAGDLAEQQKARNRKGKSGGFQSMGLSYPVFKAIQNQGFKVPTPIQRRAIPAILKGTDVVAMARTGSGKTAAFLIPLVEKLAAHSVKVGARALILSPSRELAIQTLKVTKQFTKNTDLRSSVFVGGDDMEDQFAALASNPDIIVATPGRLMHLIIEMNLALKTVEYVVFDEADRLFEMGFAEQLREITLRLSPGRQTLLFSATLPKVLVDFARAGLENPILIRLDVDSKISRDLQMYFFAVKQQDKEGALLHILGKYIPTEQQTVVFVSTKHHVEYVSEIIRSNGYAVTYIYGALDQAARMGNLAKFRNKKANILVVTDVAARGIDIPLLDNVINYDFPPSSKLFIHRVGRTARAGKSGSAWSFVSTEELPHMLDLQLFTGRPLIFASRFENSAEKPDYTSELVFGEMPMTQVALESESLAASIKGNITLETLRDSSKNAYKMYLKSRPAAAKTAYDRAKELSLQSHGIHPLFCTFANPASQTDEKELNRYSMVKAISDFRPPETVFEVHKRGGKSAEAVLMQKRRTQLSKAISETHSKWAKIKENELESQAQVLQGKHVVCDIQGAQRSAYKDSEYYLNYRPSDEAQEAGYSVHSKTGFVEKARQAAMDLVGDEVDDMRKRKADLVWDSSKHRFQREQIGSDNKKRIKTDAGTVVLATYQSERFEKWQKKTKVEFPKAGETELKDTVQPRKYRHNNTYAPNVDSKSFQRKLASKEKEWRKEGKKGTDLANAKKDYLGQIQKQKQQQQQHKQELKSAAQIAKQRREKEKRREKTGRHKRKRN